MISLLVAVNVLGAAVCSGEASTSSTDGTTVYGKVTKVNGKNITMTVGTWNGNKQGIPPNGQEAPSDMLILTKETKTITISDTSIIKKQSMEAPAAGNSTSKPSASTSASLSDITVGSTLKLTYDTSGKLSSVEIVGGMDGNGAPGGTNGGSGYPTVTGAGA